MVAWNASFEHAAGDVKPGAPPHASMSFTLDVASLPERTPSFEERVALVTLMIDRR
jgi:hypothetical protein